MDLIYLYIKDHPVLKDCNLNFGGQYRLEYNYQNREVTVRDNPFYIPDFFMPADQTGQRALITNVTAVVGNNGAGKTSLLDFLAENFATGNSGIKYAVILACREEDGTMSLYHSDRLPLETGNFRAFNFTVNELRGGRETISTSGTAAKFQYFTYPHIDAFDQTSMIFFSNVFDARNELEVGGIRYISTNYLARADFHHNIEQHILNAELFHKELDSFVFGEVERQIAFLNSPAAESELPFQLPDRLSISIKNNLTDFDRAFSTSTRSPLQEYGAEAYFILAARTFRQKIDANDKPHFKVRDYVTANVVLNFIFELAANYRGIQSIYRFSFDIKRISNAMTVEKLAARILNDIESQKEKQSYESTGPRIEFNELTQLIKNTRAFLKLLPDLIDPESVDYNSGTSFSIDIKKNAEGFKAFHAVYLQTFIFRPFLNFYWRHLSSGEKAFLNLSARFYSLSDAVLKGDKLKAHLIIMIDEGDIYLHPDWQKRFIALVTNFLSRLFAVTPEGKRRTIQLFIATNSPIPVSDLPNSNVIFLQKRNGITSVRDSLDDKKQTFGANIHTLFADSFFLTGGTIGDFAFAKINSLITLLQGDMKGIEDHKDEIKKTIMMIGEPVIKSKLLQMLNERLSLDLIRINSRVTQLEDDMRNLKDKK